MADRHPVGPTAVPVTSLSVTGSGGGGGSLTDGDYGDVIVGGGGTTMDIDSAVLSTFGRSLIDDVDAAAAQATLGLGTLATQNGTFSGTSSGTNTGDQFTNMTSPRILGRITAGFGPAEELTGTQTTTLLDTFTSALKGLAPASGGGTVNFLRADGSWAAPPSGGGSGSITASGYTMTTARMLGRTTAATGAIEEMTAANVKSFLVMTAADVGALPITAGAGAWSGYTLFDSGSSSGLVAHNTTNAVYASLSTDSAATGYFYGQNNGATTWIQFGGGMTANTRQPITGSHAFEFSTTPYVGANAIFHAGNYPTPRVQSVTSSATVTPTFSDDLVKITAQAAALNLANPTGTAVPAKPIKIRIKDNGTARAITYGTQYRAIGVTLPTTTVANKTLYLGMIYNSDDTKWDVVAVAQEA